MQFSPLLGSSSFSELNGVLQLTSYRHQDGLTVSLGYPTAAYPEAQMKEFVVNLVKLLKRAHPADPETLASICR